MSNDAVESIVAGLVIFGLSGLACLLVSALRDYKRIKAETKIPSNIEMRMTCVHFKPEDWEWAAKYASSLLQYRLGEKKPPASAEGTSSANVKVVRPKPPKGSAGVVVQKRSIAWADGEAVYPPKRRSGKVAARKTTA